MRTCNTVKILDIQNLIAVIILKYGTIYFYHSTLEPKLLYLSKEMLEVTPSAIVVLTPFLDSPNLPKEGLSGLKEKFSWRDT